MKRVLLAAVAAAVLTCAPAAFATQGEQELSLGAAAGASGGLWAGADARWLYDLTDFWALGAGLHDRFQWSALPAGRQAATLEARFVVDALQWVPSIGGGIGAAIGHDIAPTFVPWAHADFGADYRPNRNWGVGARIGVEGQINRSSDFAWVGGVYWNWYFGKGIGLDL